VTNPAPIRTSAAGEIFQARDQIRTLLMRSEADAESPLLETVAAALDEIQGRLDSLGGLQSMFEGWTNAK